MNDLPPNIATSRVEGSVASLMRGRWISWKCSVVIAGPPRDVAWDLDECRAASRRWERTCTSLPLMKDSVGLRELRQQASELVRRAEGGEEILVTVAGRPAARLGPFGRKRWRTGREIAPFHLYSPALHAFQTTFGRSHVEKRLSGMLSSRVVVAYRRCLAEKSESLDNCAIEPQFSFIPLAPIQAGGLT